MGGEGGARSSHGADSGGLTASSDDGHRAEDDGRGRLRGSTREGRKAKLLSPLLVLKVFFESRY